VTILYRTPKTTAQMVSPNATLLDTHTSGELKRAVFISRYLSCKPLKTKGRYAIDRSNCEV
jgi:hypothetical protein